MKKSSLFLALTLASGLASATAVAQLTFSGTDTFGDGVLNIGAGQRWVSTGSYSTVTGAFSESGGTLNYASTTEGSKFLRWSGINTYTGNSLANDWTATVTVTNTNSPGTGFVSSGIEISTAWEGNGVNGSLPGSLYTNAYYSFMLLNGGVETEFSKYDAGLDDFTAPARVFTNIGDSTDVLLRLSWTASSKLLTADYSTDAGATFFNAGSFDLAGAQAGYVAPYNDKFSLDLFVNSGGGAGPVTGGVSFDNMSVSAVPEPSTYAMIAGLGALALAAWRRQAKPAPTTA